MLEKGINRLETTIWKRIKIYQMQLFIKLNHLKVYIN